MSPRPAPLARAQDVDRLLRDFARLLGHPLFVTYGDLAERLNDLALTGQVLLATEIERAALEAGAVDEVHALRLVPDARAFVRLAFDEAARWAAEIAA